MQLQWPFPVPPDQAIKNVGSIIYESPCLFCDKRAVIKESVLIIRWYKCKLTND